ncbi:MAG: sulfite exporter TauE/SafE family protein, partial [Candidatus Thiodiazotropha weberae]|nr:sulfite exporter TauE/SafE family protein [Candidatus Thiodiazotropha weberae]
AGLWVEDMIAEPWVRWFLGGATILVALSIIFRRQPNACQSSCQSVHGIKPDALSASLKPTPLAHKSLPGSLYMMGFGMALNPCAPLTTLILAAATSASLLNGAVLGAGFAMGAVFLPTLVFATGLAHFSQQIRLHLNCHRLALENTSVGLLILIGCATALGWITP